MAERAALPESIFKVNGFSGYKFRVFLNLLMARVPDPRYLEIGLFRGASMCSAIYRNKLKAVGVDNWTEYGVKADEFWVAFNSFKHADADTTIIEQDFRTIKYADYGPFNILFYDGPHREQDQYDGIFIPMPAMTSPALVIVDDWNWNRVRTGTYNALRARGMRVDYAIEVRTSFKNEHLPFHSGPTSEWHNGTFLAVISKDSAATGR